MPRQKVNGARQRQVDRIAKRVARRVEIFRAKQRPLRRREIRKPRIKKLIAYDLETTRIAAGNPKPLYITAFCEEFAISGKIDSLPHLREILLAHFLTEENRGARFVAWNGNKFDCYFIAASLLTDSDFILRPYLTKSKSLRGLKVQLRSDKKMSWEFLDGMAMTGAMVSLDEFLRNFAPDYQKLQAPDFEKETFDHDNPDHVRYAERDSEGLFHAMVAAQKITMGAFNIPLQPTVGNMGIKIFQSKVPEHVVAWPPGFRLKEVLRDHVMRGGFCHMAKKYHGPIWKYDINQAYAAAMRECWLPCGQIFETTKNIPSTATCGIFLISASNPKNAIPFYCRDDKGVSFVAYKHIDRVWLTSVEIDQLRAEQWEIETFEGYFWDDAFNMTDYVNQLEELRLTAPGGVNSAQGLMMKYIGNNSYGKTVESLDGIELLLSLERPEGFYNYQGEDEILQHCWFRFKEPLMREYHQPQIGSFITAHVRMVVRRAILQCPDAWLYADTDCVVFSEPVELNVDPRRYGFWKQETAGEWYKIIAKKVYASDALVKDKKTGRLRNKVLHAKGINVKRLTPSDMTKWHKGISPKQIQVQRQNFVKVMTGADMFTEREKVGQIFQKVI